MTNDYIRRQDAVDALGVTKNATKYGGDHSGYDTMMLYEIHDALTGIPAADVVPVVRCKDCKHDISSQFDTAARCNLWGCLKPKKGFCDAGKRREE